MSDERAPKLNKNCLVNLKNDDFVTSSDWARRVTAIVLTGRSGTK